MGAYDQNLLTPGQLAKKKPGVKYADYKSWVTKTRASREFKRSTGGQAPISQEQLMEMARGLYPQLGLHQLTEPQINSRAQETVRSFQEPQIDLLRNTINSRSESGTKAIEGYTSTFMDRLKSLSGEQTTINNAATAEQAATNAALSQMIKGSGENLSQGLAAQLAQINADPNTVAQTAGVVGAQGTGASGSTAALGASTLSRLIAEGAGRKSWAAEQPALAANQGLNDLSMFQGQLNRNLDEGLDAINADTPGFVNTQMEQLRNRNLQMTSMNQARNNAIAQFISSGQDRNLLLGELGLKSQQAADQSNYDWTGNPNGNPSGTGTNADRSPYDNGLKDAGDLLIGLTTGPGGVAKDFTWNQIYPRVVGSLRTSFEGTKWAGEEADAARRLIYKYTGMIPPKEKPATPKGGGHAAGPSRPDKPPGHPKAEWRNDGDGFGWYVRAGATTEWRDGKPYAVPKWRKVG